MIGLERYPEIVLISLGSNCGDRLRALEDGKRWLSSVIDEAVFSPPYETPAEWGGERTYMNMVAMGKTLTDPVELDLLAKNFEKRKGRDREARLKGDVPIDIDVVAYGDKIIRQRDFDSRYFRKGLEMLGKQK